MRGVSCAFFLSIIWLSPRAWWRRITTSVEHHDAAGANADFLLYLRAELACLLEPRRVPDGQRVRTFLEFGGRGAVLSGLAFGHLADAGGLDCIAVHCGPG